MSEIKPIGEYQVPRLAFAFLLFTQAVLIFPHLIEFPVILLPVWLFCTLWRFMIYRGQWHYPSAIVKAGLIFFSVIAIVATQPKWMSVETAILSLLVAFLLKLLEMKQQRDVLVQVYLSYFVIVGQLLLSQDILSGMYMLTGLLLVTATLIATRSATIEIRWYEPLRQASQMLALSVPVMLVIFLIFPRLEPLWAVPKPADAGKTGVSGRMTPGDFSQLAESDELAFRVSFDGAVPPLKDLYWRGIVLSTFDGRTWSPINQLGYDQAPLEDIEYAVDAKAWHYRITMEPTQQHWMFVLNGVTETTANAEFTREFTLLSKHKIEQREDWHFVSYPQAIMGKKIRRYEYNNALFLPEGFNPKTITFANDLWENSLSNEDYIKRVLDYFHQNNFYYTLTPPQLGRNSVDDFLFNTRKGFCEHYASAFVVLMRAVGIPARVVTGYQGGDINPYEHNVTVRQLDAHAWAEVWLRGQGWQRVDPTYAVAPERIEKGSQQSLQQDENFLAKSPLSPIRYNHFSWLTSLRYRFDQLNYLWHIWVLDYTGDRQQEILLGILGKISAQKIGFLLGTGFLAFGLAIGVYIVLKSPPQRKSVVDRLYHRFERKVARKGLVRLSGEGPLDFAGRAKVQWPQSEGEIDSITDQYVCLNYAKHTDRQEYSRLMKQFRHDVIRFVLR